MQPEESAQFRQRLLKTLTFATTFVSMMLGLSFIPLLPQPLPIILSFLIAFTAFKNPKSGMCIGSLLIGLGLIYHLARVNFIALLGGSDVRALSVLIILLLFLLLPLSINYYEDAITISIGIIAATLLFFGEFYYFAIPLILIFAVLYRKARLGLTLSYYILISLPLQAMQYIKYTYESNIKTYPPIYVPLTEIYKDIQVSMSQVTFNEIFKVIETIGRQVTLDIGPDIEKLKNAIFAYENSLPGIILFLVIISSLVSAVALITLGVSKLFKGVELTKKYAKYIEIFIPAITASITTIVFFILMSSLQSQLAFSAEIDTSKIMISTLVSVIVTVPASMIDYMLKISSEIEKRSNEIIRKTQELLSKLQSFEESLTKVKNSIPVNVSSVEGKMLLIKDNLNDVLNKAKARLYDLQELDDKNQKLEKELGNEINNLTFELNVLLEEYHTHTNFEYASWIAKFKELGLIVEALSETVFQKELDMETRLNLIQKVLDEARNLTNRVITNFEQIYSIIRALYDPNLPEESPTTTFAKQKLDEKDAPWIALDALFISLQNLEKQYGNEIAKSVQQLEKSMNSIVNLSSQKEKLIVLGRSLTGIVDYSKKAKDFQILLEKKELNVMKIMIIKEALESALSIAKDVLKILYEELQHKEELIDSLLPIKGYEWGKNLTLTERIRSTMEIISNPSMYGLDIVMENLHKSLSYVEECIETISFYNEKYELFLNYSIAKLAIEKMLKERKSIQARDLPFELKCAEEYLKLFCKQNQDFIFDETNMMLIRK